jgi:hypothetical protein
MKKIILLSAALLVMLVSLEGCFWGYDRYDRDGRGGGHDSRGGGYNHGGDHDDRGGDRGHHH